MRPLVPPSTQVFEELARQAISSMPSQFREHLSDVVIKIEEFATSAQLQAVNIENKWNLSGLYEGSPLTKQTIWDSGRMPPVISLFRQPLMAEMYQTGVRLEELVHHVVIHEAGHHFGFSDEEMHELEHSVD